MIMMTLCHAQSRFFLALGAIFLLNSCSAFG